MKEYVWGGSVIVLTLLLIFTVTILEDRITVELPSDNCEKGLTLIVHNDYTKLKCGYNVVAEWKEYVDYYRTYGEPDRWVNDYRKRTKIELKVLDYSPTHFIVRKEVPYYKGRTGTDGTLYIDYTFTKDRVKWDYSFNHTNTAKHRIRLKLLRFEEEYGFDFIPDDNLYYFMDGLDYYYGNVKGNLFIDPMIRISTEGLQQWKFSEPFNNRSFIHNGTTTAIIESGVAKTINISSDEFDDASINTSFIAVTESSVGDGNTVVAEASGELTGDANMPTPYTSGYNADIKFVFNHTMKNRTQVFLDGEWEIDTTGGNNQATGNDAWIYATNGTDYVLEHIFDKNCGSGGEVLYHYVYNITYYKEQNKMLVYRDGAYVANITVGTGDLKIKTRAYVYSCFRFDSYSGVTRMDLRSFNATDHYVNTDICNNQDCHVRSTNITVGSNVSAIVTSFDDSGTCVYEYSTDNSSWTSITTGNTYSIASPTEQFFYRSNLSDGCEISELNFTFNETVSVESVNITPATALISDTLTCEYTFFNSTGGDGNNQSNVTWYINAVANLTNSDTINSSYFRAGDTVYCKVLPFDGTTYGIEIQSSNNVTIDYVLAAFLSIGTYETTKKWESGTTPLINVSAVDTYDNATIWNKEVCLSISLHDYGTNYSCDNETVLYNFTIPYVEEVYYNETLSSVAVVGNETFYFNMYNWSTLVNATLDISSSDGILDASLDIANDSTTNIFLRGTIASKYLTEERYEDNTTTQEMQFFNSRFATEYFNLSTAGNVIKNITLTLNASASNQEGIDHTNYWKTATDFNDTGNTSGESPTFMYDDLVSEVSGRWNFNTGGGATSEYDGTNERVYTSSAAATSCNSFGEYYNVNENAFFNSKDLDMSDTNKRWEYSITCTASAVSLDSGTSSGSGTAGCYFYVTNDESGGGDIETLASCYCVPSDCFYDCAKNCANPDACSNSLNSNLTIFEKSNGDWEVYLGGALLRTITPPSGDLEIKGTSTAQASASCDVGSASGSGAATTAINFIKQGGFGNNYSDSADTFSTGTFELVSDVIFNTSDQTDTGLYLQNALVTYDAYEPSGCDIRLYLRTNYSDDTAWQEFTSGLLTDFTKAGSNLSYKINSSVTSTDNLNACALSNLNILVSSDYVSNISIYFGDSSGVSYLYTDGDLNETNTPLTISLDYTDVNTYFTSSGCDGEPTCRVPMKFKTLSGTTGVLDVYNISINQSLDDASFAVSSITTEFKTCASDLTIPCNVTNQVNGSNGTITFSDLAIRYLGNGNITVNASVWNSSGTKLDDSLTMIIRYTPFTLAFTQPLIEDLFFNPWSNNIENVSPYGQYIGQFYNRSIQNISSDAVLHEMDLYISTNYTDDWWDETRGTNYTQLYIMNQTDKNVANNISLNTTRQAFVQNATNSTETPIYILLDLFNVTEVPYFDWWNWWESYCSDSGDGYGACVVIS